MKNSSTTTLKLSEILFADSKKMWYGARNQVNPAYTQWANSFETSAVAPPAEIVRDVPAKFDLSRFRDLTTYEERIEYLRNTAMRIGAGSSRVVFAISPKRVIKLAGGSRLADDIEKVIDSGTDKGNMRKAGEYQNHLEMKTYKESSGADYGKLLPMCYELAGDDSWLLAELVRPLGSDHELARLMGMDINQYKDWMSIMYSGRYDTRRAQYFFRDLRSRGMQMVEMIRSFLDSNPDIEKADMTRPEQWGKGADGRLVLLDFGADKEIIRKHYR